jgi:hypothetical protein
VIGALSQAAVTKMSPSNANNSIGFADTDGPAPGQYRTYGFFALPFATAQNMQAECETGTLGTGWSSVADANASAGNTAQLASGTASGNADTLGVLWTPKAGTYFVAARYRNSGAPTNATEVQVGGLIGGAFTSEITLGSGTGSKASYVIAQSAAFALSGSQTFQDQIKSAATTSATWDFDEMFLLPVTLTTDNSGPQDIWQQFAYEIRTRQIAM